MIERQFKLVCPQPADNPDPPFSFKPPVMEEINPQRHSLPLFPPRHAEYRSSQGMAVRVLRPGGYLTYKPAITFKMAGDDGAYYQWLRCLREGKVNLNRK